MLPVTFLPGSWEAPMPIKTLHYKITMFYLILLLATAPAAAQLSVLPQAQAASWQAAPSLHQDQPLAPPVHAPAGTHALDTPGPANQRSVHVMPPCTCTAQHSTGL
jgi:hypothetical protein